MILKFGIDFERVSFANLEIAKLEVKIDKKLIITADQIVVKPSENKLATKNINKEIQRAFRALNFVEKLEIKTLKIDKNNFEVLYSDEFFTISDQYGQMRTKLEWINIGVLFKIEELTYKKQNITGSGNGFFDPAKKIFFADIEYASDLISGSMNINADLKIITAKIDRNHFRFADHNGTIIGQLKVDIEKEIALLDAEVNYLDIRGEVSAKISGEKATITATNATSKSLAKLVEILPINNNIKPWIYGNIRADHYEAKEFYLEIDLKNKKPLLNTMFLNAYALNTDIKFNPNIPPAFGKKVEVSITNNNLYVALDSGEYIDQKADAFLEITNLFDPHSVKLALDISTNALFKEPIRNILKEFGVSLDLIQNSGENSAKFALVLDLYKHPIGVDIQTLASSNNTFLGLYGIDLEDSSFEFHNHNEKVTIDNLKTSHEFFDNSDLKVAVDAHKKELSIDGSLYNFYMINSALVSSPKLDINLTGDWNNSAIVFASKDHDSKLIVDSKNIEFQVADISKLKAVVPAVDLLDVNAGVLDLIYSQGKTKADFEITTKTPIFFTDNKPISRIKGVVEVEKTDFFANILNGLVVVDQEDDFFSIAINNLEVDAFAVENFLKRREELFTKGDSKAKKVLMDKLFIFGKNSAIRYKDKKLKTERFSIDINQDKIESEFQDKNSSFVISKNKNSVVYSAKNIKSNWVNGLTGMNMTKGVWNATATGDFATKDHYGVVHIKDAQFKEAMLLTNVIAIINTLPALAQFRSPGFTSEGFEVENGVIEFYFANNKLFLNAVRLYGKNTDIIAQGSIDFAKNSVDIYASVQTVKGASNIIGAIPLFGYLLLGDSKKIENILHITGKLEKPEVKSEVAKELLFYPLGVAKRILTLPMKAIE